MLHILIHFYVMVISVLWFYSQNVWIKHFKLLIYFNKNYLQLWVIMLKGKCFQQCKYFLF